MKAIGSFLLKVVIAVWFVIALFVTVCLLSYNEFAVSKFGRSALLIMDENMNDQFKRGDLAIVTRESDNEIAVGDYVFYYNSAMDSNVLIFLDQVQSKEPITKTETTYTLDGAKVSGEYIIGKAENAKVYHNLGTILGVLTSKWGFMFLIIFPTLFAIIYEIMMIVEGAKENKKEETE